MTECRGIYLRFGEKQVLSDCTLRVAPEARIALTGPSGCGKTSLLRVLTGLQPPDRGSVRLSVKRLGMVFQEPRLLSWRTAAENVNLVLSDSSETLLVAEEWLSKLEMSDAVRLYPAELSGGMQQRVAIARALAVQPDLLVLDEPFKGLDSALRDRMLHVIRDNLPGRSLLMATHSEEEAENLGCEILRYQDGRFL